MYSPSPRLGLESAEPTATKCEVDVLAVSADVLATGCFHFTGLVVELVMCDCASKSSQCCALFQACRCDASWNSPYHQNTFILEASLTHLRAPSRGFKEHLKDNESLLDRSFGQGEFLVQAGSLT